MNEAIVVKERIIKSNVLRSLRQRRDRMLGWVGQQGEEEVNAWVCSIKDNGEQKERKSSEMIWLRQTTIIQCKERLSIPTRSQTFA